MRIIDNIDKKQKNIKYYRSLKTTLKKKVFGRAKKNSRRTEENYRM